MSKQGFIYKYSFPNGKVYIGQTRTSIEKRHYEHMYASEHDRRSLCEVAITKYGEPKLDLLETIEVGDNEKTKLISLLNAAEKKWISEYDATNRRKGYNIQNGGEIVTPEEFILEEAWWEIFEKEKRGNQIAYVRNILDIIIDKNGNIGDENEIIDFHLKSSDLTKEERAVWYGLKFDSEWAGQSTTFSAYVKNCPVADYLSDIVGNAFDEYTQYVSGQIWGRIMNKKDKIIANWWRNKD